MTSLTPLSVPTFLNDHEALTVDALAARVMPGDASDPGAREARVVVYIDRALAGAYRDLQPLYQSGVDDLDRLCVERRGRTFAQLTPAEQDAVLGELDVVVEAQPTEHGAEPDGDVPPLDPRQARLAYFFAVVREHVLQGMFCDPVYGGNHDAAGWRLVGFPGAHWGYEEHQGELGFDASVLPVKTLADLRAERGA